MRRLNDCATYCVRLMDRMTMRMAVTSKALATVALAALSAAAWPLSPASAQDGTVQIAQSREIEVYYDDYGRRVIADAYTGQILSIEAPRNGLDRRATGAVRGKQRFEDDRYLDEEFDRPRRGDRYDRRNDDEQYVRGREQRYPGEGEAYYDDRNSFPEAPAERERNVVRKALPQAAAPASKPVTPRSEPKLSPANPSDVPVIGRKAVQSVANLQILLDRAGVSPGVVDGHMGSNVEKALSAYNELTGDNLKTTDTAGIEAALLERGGAAFTEYTITQQDAAGPYVASIPADYVRRPSLRR
jgi:hypothetical protein